MGKHVVDELGVSQQAGLVAANLSTYSSASCMWPRESEVRLARPRAAVPVLSKHFISCRSRVKHTAEFPGCCLEQSWNRGLLFVTLSEGPIASQDRQKDSSYSRWISATICQGLDPWTGLHTVILLCSHPFSRTFSLCLNASSCLHTLAEIVNWKSLVLLQLCWWKLHSPWEALALPLSRLILK